MIATKSFWKLSGYNKATVNALLHVTGLALGIGVGIGGTIAFVVLVLVVVFITRQ